LFNADEWTDMTKLIVAFCSFVNASKNDFSLDSSLGIILLAIFMKIGEIVQQIEREVTGTHSRKEGKYLACYVPVFKKDTRLIRRHG
jgi:hypothetical protein